MYQRRLEAIERLRDADGASILRDSRVGLEKESLRVDLDGHIARTPHPRALGSALTHPYITTDFSEALLEFVTPPFADSEETLRFLDQVHQFVYQHLDRRGAVVRQHAVHGARRRVGAHRRLRHLQRRTDETRLPRGLSLRYGRVMQTIAGVHFNFSLPATAWRVLLPGGSTGARCRHVINDAYFGCVRNFQRFGWLVPYLFGSSPAVCKSFLHGRHATASSSSTTARCTCPTPRRCA